ncbi:MAG TPA: serine/threonine-protein kinase [Thermoanaerobaculia bacterium]|nr:serine/threonine-protein kinase [Thermoanaerobaculia bacterium]
MPIDDATQRQTPEETPTLIADGVGQALSLPGDVTGHLPGTRQAESLSYTPGTRILNRYRIINLLGRGGMGEVYRADDLKLGQQVALKFIPRALLADPAMLRMLLGEVRIGREVSHPNVCRLYDIAEFEGDHFIAMQFVDGEDLASLLRRIGRLPVEKAIDIARDLAAGLAAAHERGVIHRDLKPANVMIDGRGRAHITDFGLAIVSGDPQRGVAGTPAYMAPEQLSAQEVTTASDVYALGLILWEMLTGKRMFDPGSITQIAEAHNQPKPRLGSSIRDLPPKIESLVMQCLDEEPARRPQSARAVLSMLPGGDPLAAAIAAGETPSPELVAAAAKSGVVAPAIAFSALALFLVMLAGVAVLNPRSTIFSLERFHKPPDVLADRAEEVVKASGIAGEPADRSGTFADRKRDLRSVSDADRVVFVYRRAATQLVTRDFSLMVTPDNPPLNAPGMANVEITGDGKLLSFTAVPRLDAAPAPHAIDELFRAARFDRAQFREAAPQFPPPAGADTRMAWDGAAHIEAAMFHGAPVWFAVNPSAAVRERQSITGIGGVAWNAVYAALLAIAIVLAALNVRRGRGDRRGAQRAAIVLGITALAYATFTEHFSGTTFGDAVSITGGQALFQATIFAIAYLAVEPYVRRHWPVLLISWQRLVDLRWRDPLVGRDFGLGLISGITSAVIVRVVTMLTAKEIPAVVASRLESMSSLTNTAAWIVHVVPESMLYALWALLFLVVGRVFIRRAFIYAPLFVIAIGVAISPRTGTTAGDLACGMLNALMLILALRYGGLLAASASWIAYHLPDGLPFTFDANAWFAGRAWFTLALFVVLAAYACFVSLAPGRRFANVPATA